MTRILKESQPTVTEASTMKDLPMQSRMYFIDKNYAVADALKAYEAKYHVKPVTAILYKQYLYIQHEDGLSQVKE